jgi:hypothetical protein
VGVAGSRSVGQVNSSRVIAAARTRTSASPAAGVGTVSRSTLRPSFWSRTARISATPSYLTARQQYGRRPRR